MKDKMQTIFTRDHKGNLCTAEFEMKYLMDRLESQRKYPENSSYKLVGNGTEEYPWVFVRRQ